MNWLLLTPGTKNRTISVPFTARLPLLYVWMLLPSDGASGASPTPHTRSRLAPSSRSWRDAGRGRVDFRCRPFLGVQSALGHSPFAPIHPRRPRSSRQPFSSLICIYWQQRSFTLLTYWALQLLSRPLLFPTSVEANPREHTTLPFCNHSNLFVSTIKASVTSTSLSGHYTALIMYTNSSSAAR